MFPWTLRLNHWQVNQKFAAIFGYFFATKFRTLWRESFFPKNQPSNRSSVDVKSTFAICADFFALVSEFFISMSEKYRKSIICSQRYFHPRNWFFFGQGKKWFKKLVFSKKMFFLQTFLLTRRVQFWRACFFSTKDLIFFQFKKKNFNFLFPNKKFFSNSSYGQVKCSLDKCAGLLSPKFGKNWQEVQKRWRGTYSFFFKKVVFFSQIFPSDFQMAVWTSLPNLLPQKLDTFLFIFRKWCKQVKHFEQNSSKI